MAAQDAPNRQFAAFQGAVHLQCFCRVLRAAGPVTAARAEQGADQPLIEAHQADHDEGQPGAQASDEGMHEVSVASCRRRGFAGRSSAR